MCRYIIRDKILKRKNRKKCVKNEKKTALKFLLNMHYKKGV